MHTSRIRILFSLLGPVLTAGLVSFCLAAAALPEAVKQLKSPDVMKRRVAAQELVNLRNPDTAPALLKALSDKDSYVRTLAVRALGYIRYPAAGPQLVEILAKDPSKEVR